MGTDGTVFQSIITIRAQDQLRWYMAGTLISSRLQFMLYGRHCTGGWH